MAAVDLSKLSLSKKRAPKPRKTPWVKWTVGGACAVAALLGYWAMPQSVAVQTTSVVVAYPSQRYLVLNASGYVAAQRKAAVSTKATGRLEWLGVQEGSVVRRGDLIARLDARDLTAQQEAAVANIAVARQNLAQAHADLQDAHRELERTHELKERGFLSPATHDTARTRTLRAAAAVKSALGSIKVAQANQKAARVSVDYTQIRAPFDGVILTKNANVGDVVTPFSSAIDSKGAVVTIADMKTLEVEADVSESSISRIAVNMPAEIVLDALPNERFRGSVARMVPTVDRTKGTISTKIRFEQIDPRILPEMSAKVSFLSQTIAEADQKPLLAVAAQAVVQRDGQTVVLKVDANGKAQVVPVSRGISIGDQVAIEPNTPDSLASGDQVVQQPTPDVAQGVALKVAAK